MIAPVIVILDECFNRFLQFAWHLAGHEVNFPFDSAVVSFYLPVGLRMTRGGYDVPDPYQPQALSKLTGDISGAANLVSFRNRHSKPFFSGTDALLLLYSKTNHQFLRLTSHAGSCVYFPCQPLSIP